MPIFGTPLGVPPRGKTNGSRVRAQFRDLNPGNIHVNSTLSPLCHPSSPFPACELEDLYVYPFHHLESVAL